jgi:hypothetical protein
MRIRLTLRRGMLLVALVAFGLFAWEELRDDLPPRFVVRGIPARIARLKPGMSYRETAEILGLEKSWIRGGTSAWSDYGSGHARHISWVYTIRPEQTATGTAGVGRPATEIGVGFDRDITEDSPDWRQLASTRLTLAYLRVDGEIVARMGR